MNLHYTKGRIKQARSQVFKSRTYDLAKGHVRDQTYYTRVMYLISDGVEPVSL